MDSVQGQFEASGLKIAVVATRWNADIVDRLVDAALDVLADCGVDDDDILLVRVPGAFELPLAVDRVADKQNVDGVIALGAIIRGETPHFDFIATECARGLSAGALEYGLPVGFGVITADTPEQADERAALDEDRNKGGQAASAVIEMATLLAALDD